MADIYASSQDLQDLSPEDLTYDQDTIDGQTVAGNVKTTLSKPPPYRSDDKADSATHLTHNDARVTGTPEQLHTISPSTSSKVPIPGAAYTIQDIECQDKATAVTYEDDPEALKRYKIKLDRLLIVASFLSIAFAIAYAGCYIFTEDDWAEFINPILETIFRHPLEDSCRLKAPKLDGWPRFFITISPLVGVYNSVQIIREVLRRKKSLRMSLKSDEDGKLHATVVHNEHSWTLGLLTQLAAMAFYQGITNFKDHQAYRLVIITLFLFLTSMTTWSVCTLVRRSFPTYILQTRNIDQLETPRTMQTDTFGNLTYGDTEKYTTV